jgi:hypothetical protein
VSRKDADSRGLEAHGNDAADGGQPSPRLRQAGKAQGPGEQASQGQSESSDGSDRSDVSDAAPPVVTSLTFAGASFVPAVSDDPDVLVFSSGDDQPSPRLR